MYSLAPPGTHTRTHTHLVKHHQQLALVPLVQHALNGFQNVFFINDLPARPGEADIADESRQRVRKCLSGMSKRRLAVTATQTAAVA